MSTFKRGAMWLGALAMVGIGAMHFLRPAPFLRIMPPWLPYPLFLVYFTGVWEIAGGVGLLWERTRAYAGWALIALYLAVFPANIHQAVHQIQFEGGDPIPVWAMWARLPFQALFIAWAWWMTRPATKPEQAETDPS